MAPRNAARENRIPRRYPGRVTSAPSPAPPALREEIAELFARVRDFAYEDEGDAIAREAVQKLEALDDPAIFAEAARLLRERPLPPNAHWLVPLIRRAGGAEARTVLVDCVASPNILVAEAAVRGLDGADLAVHGDILLGWLRGDLDLLRWTAFAAIGRSRDARLLEAAAAHLAALSDDDRARRVVDLANHGASDLAPTIASLLPAQSGRVYAAFCGALEIMKNRAVVPQLLAQLQTATNEQLWDLTHALRVTSGADPVDDSDGGANDAPERVRARWIEAGARGEITRVPAPRFARVEVESEDRAGFDLAWGRGAIEIDYKPPTAGSTWPRWDRALLIGGERVYDTGATCGTCETVLSQVGWPEPHVSATARALDGAGFGRAGLDRAWLETMSPLLFQLRSGRYVVGLVDLALARVDVSSADQSFFVARNERRQEDAMRGEDGVPYDWPGTSHYQTTTCLHDDALAVYTVVMPTRDPASLDEAKIERFCSMLRAGERPWAIALGLVDDRYVRARWEERFFQLILLDGHHRVEAAARSGEAARIAVIFRVADSWGPPEDRARNIRRALQYFPPVRAREG
jgi:hypothetical protein